MSSDDLENFEAERELQLAQEYQDVAAMFRFAVETERRFYLANEVTVTVTGELVSKPYIDITLDTMRQFGVAVENHAYQQFQIKGKQR